MARVVRWSLLVLSCVGVAWACSSGDPKKKAQYAQDSGAGADGGAAGTHGGEGGGGRGGGEGGTETTGGEAGETAGGQAGAAGDGAAGEAGAGGEGGEVGVGPAITNLPASALCTTDGALSFVAQATGTLPITFAAGAGSTCGFAVDVAADGTVSATCPSSVTTCTVEIDAENAHGMATGILTVEVVQSGLDPGWAQNGCIRFDDGAGADSAWALAFEPSGRFVVAGTRTPGGVGVQILALWRYLPDGTLDPTFGNGGLAVYAGEAGGTGDERATGVVVDAQGRYVVSGYVLRGAGTDVETRDAAVFRFTSAGQLDTSFNSTGYFTARPFPNRNEFNETGVMQVGGQPRIAAAGLGRQGSNWNLIAYLLDEAGQPDPAFDADGFITFRASGTTAGRAMAVQNVAGEDRLLVTGEIIAGQQAMYVQRYTPAGQRDMAFGSSCVGGVVNEMNTTCWVNPSGTAAGEGIAVDRQGRVLISGWTLEGGLFDAMLWRLTVDGLPDTGFGAQAGEWWRRWDGGQSELMLGVTVDEADRIIVSGYQGPTNASPIQDVAVARYLDSGELDPSFGTGGVVLIPSVAGGDGEDRARRVVVGPLGRYYVLGTSDNAAGDADSFVCRLNP